jgi:hypothetical protein
MNINPITFSTVAENPEVHALGEIWTAHAVGFLLGYGGNVRNTIRLHEHEQW